MIITNEIVRNHCLSSVAHKADRQVNSAAVGSIPQQFVWGMQPNGPLAAKVGLDKNLK